MSGEPDASAFRPPRFDVSASRDPERGGTLVRISGELDLMSTPEFEAVVAGVTEGPVHVDVSELSFMDSTGLRALLGAARDHPTLTLHGPLRPPIQRLLELTQTLDVLPLQSD
jgi:anti-anti-sigma factor